MNEWVEVGRGSGNAFKGTFDGQGHTLNYVSKREWTSSYIDTQGGLFGYLNGATVKDLVLTGTIIITDTVTYVPAYLYTEVEGSTPVETSKYVLPEIGRVGGVYGGNGADNTAAVVAEAT